MMVLVPIRCRIPNILRSMGKTQSWLADMSGYSRHRISDYVAMRRVMSIQVAATISHHLDIHIDELYEWRWQQEE